jgi:orotate phosphoribosyltransferase
VYIDISRLSLVSSYRSLAGLLLNALSPGLRASFGCVVGVSTKGIIPAYAMAERLAPSRAIRVALLKKNDFNAVAEPRWECSDAVSENEIVLLVDDVVASGRSLLECSAVLRSAGVRCAGVVVAFDKSESRVHPRQHRLAARLESPVYVGVAADELTRFLAASEHDPSGLSKA